MSAGQLQRFRTELQVGDDVLTYDPSRRTYLVGTMAGAYRRDETIDAEDFNVRDVT